jgi:hypothetical protein
VARPQEATKMGLQDSLLDLLRGSSAEGTSTAKVRARLGWGFGVAWLGHIGC